MIAQAIEKGPGSEHIRPFVLHRDLGELARLIEITFGEDLAATGSQIVRDMRQMLLLGPLLWPAGPLVTSLSGYVWIEDHRLVGNITFVRESSRRTWVISNVGVLPEFRHRGIARQLVDTAIAHIRRCKGARIVLQVRTDNEPAMALYRRRGFATYDTLHELNLPTLSWPVLIGCVSSRFRPVRAKDRPGLHRLVAASLPRETLRLQPGRVDRFRWGMWQRVKLGAELVLGGRRRLELAADEGGELVAYGCIHARLTRGPHELQLHVSPGHRGKWELPLLEDLLCLGQVLRRDSLRAYISSTHPAAREALEELGFETSRVLAQMVLELD